VEKIFIDDIQKSLSDRKQELSPEDQSKESEPATDRSSVIANDYKDDLEKEL